MHKSARERIGRQNLSQKVPSKRGLWESYSLQGIIGKTHTQNLEILREDTLGATCSAGPFCLLPITTCSLPYPFRGKSQSLGLVPGNRGHNHNLQNSLPRHSVLTQLWKISPSSRTWHERCSRCNLEDITPLKREISLTLLFPNCAVPFAELQNRALFEGESRAKRCPEKEGGGGVASRRCKKEKRTRAKCSKSQIANR